MAEATTLARPYAEALFKASAGADRVALSGQMAALATLAGSAELRAFADNPKVPATQVFDIIAGVALQKGVALDGRIVNLLRTVLDNGRLPVLAEMATQFQALVNSASGSSDATIESAFDIDAAQLEEVKAALERRFGRKLNATVKIEPSLIGGIRVVVGDEVLDTSVRARLEQMKAALVA